MEIARFKGMFPAVNGFRNREHSGIICDMNDMKQNTDRVRKASLYSFIVFLAISALLAISSVLSGRFGEFEIKVLITTSVIAVASICSLCCSAYTGRSRKSLPGIAGVSFAGVAAVMLIIGTWTEMNSKIYWKTAAVVGVFAIAFAHSLALLAVRLRSNHSWLQVGAAINIFVLAVTISAMIVGEIDDEGVFKLVAVLAILAALETLVIPILSRLAKALPRPAGEPLSLTKREDGTYEDASGKLYEVKAMSNKSVGRHV